MGNLFSRRRREPQDMEPVLTVEPWKEIEGWSREVRDKLKSEIVDRLFKAQVPFINIALTGEVGAGKSSYFNSLNCIFKDKVCLRADVGKKATSLTKEYRVYQITPKDKHDPLRLRICDTMGLQPNKRHDCSNILQAVDGHVPDQFQFSEEEINEQTADYIADPGLKDKAHCVAIVIDAMGVERMKQEIKTKLKILREKLGAPRTFILLTHIDQACDEINKDVTKVYQSTTIRNLVNKVGVILDGLPENQIFPVMNYKEQLGLKPAMDILLLYPLRQMLNNAEEYLEEEIGKLPKPVTPATVTRRGHPVTQPTP